MAILRQRWRLRALMGLIALAGLGMALLREWPELGPVYRLKFGDPRARMAAAVRLGMRGPSKGNLAGPALEAALSDPEQGVCDCAAWALDQSGSTSPALVRTLARQVEVETAMSLRWRWQGDFYRRVEPDQALRRIRPAAATLGPLLGPALASPDAWIRLRAATLLRDAIGWSGGPTPDVAPLVLATLRDDDPSLRLVFIADLARCDAATRQAAVALLLPRLQGPDPPAAFEAAVSLAGLGPEAAPAAEALADQLGRGDVADRLATLFLLGKLGPAAKPAVPAILRAMTANDAGESRPGFINRFCSTSAWRKGGPGITLGPDDATFFESLREYAELVLGRIDRDAERQGIDLFIAMLGADSTETRRAALETLRKIGPRAATAIPALLDLIGGKAAVPARPDDSNLTFLGALAIAAVGTGDDPGLVAALVRLLGSGDDDHRLGAATALRSLKPPPNGATSALAVALRDRVPYTRQFAAEALGRARGSEGEAAVPALLAAMGDPDPRVCIAAGSSLVGRGEAAAGATPPLVRLLRAEDRGQRNSAAMTLGKFGPPARAAAATLLVALDDEVDYVRESAEQALNAVSPIEARAADGAPADLADLRRGDPEHRRAAAGDLARPGRPPRGRFRCRPGSRRSGWRWATPPRACARRPPRRWGGWAARPRERPPRSSPRWGMRCPRCAPWRRPPWAGSRRATRRRSRRWAARWRGTLTATSAVPPRRAWGGWGRRRRARPPSCSRRWASATRRSGSTSSWPSGESGRRTGPSHRPCGPSPSATRPSTSASGPSGRSGSSAGGPPRRPRRS